MGQPFSYVAKHRNTCLYSADYNGAVQTDLDTLEGVDPQADQVADVAVTAGHIVHGSANVLPVCKGQLRPVLVEHMEFAIDVVLYQQQGLLQNLFSIAVD